MSLNFGITKKIYRRDRDVAGELRDAQLVSVFGTGAVVDMVGYPVIIAATDYWQEALDNSVAVVHEPRLEHFLGVDHFLCPAKPTERSWGAGAPAFRFPTMYYCPKCGRLQHYYRFPAGKCPECGVRVLATRFMAGCARGHLEDFPYNKWVHKGHVPEECWTSEKDGKLTMTFSEERGGLDDIVLHCKRCGATRTMRESMSARKLNARCSGKRPWIGMATKYDEPGGCGEPLHGLRLGSSSTYYPHLVSALTIPPWSGAIQHELGERADYDGRLKDIVRTAQEEKPTEEVIRLLLRSNFQNALKGGICSEDDLWQAYEQRLELANEILESPRSLREKEYEMLCRGTGSAGDLQFATRSQKVPADLHGFIQQLVVAIRLREVRALRGFSRVYMRDPLEGAVEQDPDNRDCVSLSRRKLDWLPGIEMRGEGIFLTLCEARLRNWEQENGHRYAAITRRARTCFPFTGNESPRYILLHTLAHLLIRQLATQCGYSEASLRERIYSNAEASAPMAGILIYTASTDADGSLGGLARNGKTETMDSLVRDALADALWCPSDPLCTATDGQGYGALNLAACHACALLPETSCEHNNTLLDRASLIGSKSQNVRGYFEDFLGERGI